MPLKILYCIRKERWCTMEFQNYFPIWDKLTPAQKEKISGSAVRRIAVKGTVLHNGSADCTGLLLV